MNRCITYIVAIVSGWWLAHSQKHVEESHPKAPATSFNYAEPEVPALDNAKTPYQWYSTGARWGTQLEASEIPTLLESLPATLPRHTSSYLRTILWRHLAEADPIGCWRHWRKQSSRTREQLTPKLLAYWDIPKTMKSSLSTILERQPLRESREITELLRAIEEEDWSTAKTSLGNDGSWIDTVNVAAQLGQRARTAPRAAAEETLSLPHGNNVQQTTLRAVLRTWFEDDPETAWKWISARPMNRYSSDPRDSALSEWAKSDPRAALEKLAELGDSSQWWMRRNMLASWAEHAPEEALAWLESQAELTGKARTAALQGLAYGLGKHDPMRGLRFLESADLPLNAEESVIGVIAETWAKSNPDAARDWLSQLPSGNSRYSAIASALQSLQRDATDSTVALVNDLTGQDLQQPAILDVSSRILLRHDTEVAVAWMDALPNPTETVLTKFATQLAYQDAARAATWLESQTFQPSEKMIQELLASWAHEDAASAAEWITALPDGDIKNEGIKVLTANWAHIDPSGSEEWLENLPPSPARNHALTVFAGELAPTNPKIALQYIKEVDDPKLVQRFVHGALHQAAGRDADLVREFLDAHNLTLDTLLSIEAETAYLSDE